MENNTNLYYITQEQFEDIKHFKRMFELDADIINTLCTIEQPDISYGFELGKLHSHLRSCFTKMMELEDAIYSQTSITQ